MMKQVVRDAEMGERESYTSLMLLLTILQLGSTT
jgi:hypothetical protein